MAEWSKAHAWKVCRRETVSRVRIPVSPPLHFAAAFGIPESIQALLKAGADVMARNEDGLTPLHDAAEYATPESIQVLLKAGADAKAKSQHGITPWDLAQDNDALKGTKGYWALKDAQ